MTGQRRLRAVIYARQSLDREGNEHAVQRQVDDCRALAAARGWDVVEVAVDNSVSASTGKARPGYERVLELVRSCAVDRIVVWHVDRLTRRLLDLEHVVELAEATGVGIATVTGDLDLSTDTGRLLARILAAVARAEVERKGARQRRANAQRRAAGIVPWTVRPAGYDRVGTDIIVIESEASALRTAAASLVDGVSIAQVLRDLHAGGHTTTLGNPWTPRALKRALTSPRLIGRVPYGGTDTGLVGRWPAILDPQVQARIVELLADPSRRSSPGATLRYWLSGALTCGRCGTPCYANAARGTASAMVYRCRGCNGISRDLALVDDVVAARLLHQVRRPELVAAFADVGDRDGDARRLLGELRERRDGLAQMVADGLMPLAVARERIEHLAARIAEQEALLVTPGGSGPVQALQSAVDPAVEFAGWTAAQRRRTFSALVSRCRLMPVGKGEKDRRALIRSIEITWRWPDGGGEAETSSSGG